MAVREILTMGNPLLLKVAEPIEAFNTPQLNQLLEDMFDTMRAADGAGIAAPQIGVSQQVVIFGVESNPRYPDAEQVPTTVLINPKIEVLDEELEAGWEGCLSVPNMRGLVERPKAIRYSGFDAQGRPIEATAEGFHARVVQHEVDHLLGVLYPLRMQDLRYFGFENELFRQSESSK